MFRLLGFLVGSFVSIAALKLLIGTPDFHLGKHEADVARFDAAVEKLKAKQAVLQAQSEPPDLQPDDAADEPAVLPDPVAESAPGPATDDPVARETSAVAAPLPETPAPEWHSFWTPFRTEIAARGFVSQLESVTGLDYRILKMDRGGYEVAFSYATDDELDTKLTRISSATGLDLSGDLP